MKKVLEKASSTEVIHALTLDTRLKSHSVSSLGSSCNRSDSFASVSSAISNGPTVNNSGSTASVGSTHSYHASGDKHGGLVRVRSASGRPLSDAVSMLFHVDINKTIFISTMTQTRIKENK